MADGVPKNVPVALPAKRGFPRPFGRYILEKSLSRGGMGEIFLAIPRGVQARCVIKTIRSDLTGDKEFVGRFADEAKIMMRFVHDNIIRIFDCGKVGKSYYIAMEFSYGRDLGDVLDRAYERAEPMPTGLGLYLTQKMLMGLDYIHNARTKDGRPMRLVHRDISPQNILIGFDGSIKLIDFGLARTELLPGRTQGQLAVGKYGYMSPEQARHDKIDGRADIYSLGVMLFEVFTGDRLVDEQDQATLWSRVLSPEHRNPRSVLPKLSKEIDTLVMNAVAAKPDHRFESAQSMLDYVRRLRAKSSNQDELKRYMKYLYPRVEPSAPALPDLSATNEGSEYSMIIAMSEEGAKSVFGRGQLPVEFTQQVHIADILPELERRRKLEKQKKRGNEVEAQTAPQENRVIQRDELHEFNHRPSFGHPEEEDQPTMIHRPDNVLMEATSKDTTETPHANMPILRTEERGDVEFPDVLPDKFREDEATVMMDAPPQVGVSPFSSEPKPDKPITFGNAEAAEAATRVEEPVPVGKPHKIGRSVNPRVIKERRAIVHEPAASVTMRQTVEQTPANPGVTTKNQSSDEIEAYHPIYGSDPSPNWMMAGLILLGLTVIVLLLVIMFRP
jgi:serine/threonine protein kinase